MQPVKQSTAMQDNIKWLTESKSLFGFCPLAYGFLMAQMIKSLVKERSQIVDAWGVGWNDRGNDDGDYSQHADGEVYFTESFKQ